MIFEELILNKVSEIETSNPGGLSSVAAIYVETRFSIKNSGGIDLPSLRTNLKTEAINIFSLYYANLGKGAAFFTNNTVDGTAITSEGDRITLERVEFINLGEEECEDVVFKKVFFIPLDLLKPPAGTGSAGEDPILYPSEDLPTIARIKICNYRDFKKKVRFIQTFMKINFLALQRPTSRSIVKGINFRKFSTKKKQLTKLASFLDTVIPNKPNKDGESITIHFADNFQTISKIEYVNEKVSNEIQLVFRQSAEEFETRKYKALNDARANFYLYNFESIYPDLFATTFRGLNIKFDNLVRRNFIAPNVEIVQNDCLAAANSRQNVSAADITARIRQSLSDVPTKEARSLLKDNPFKTAEDLIDESGFLENSDIRDAMKQTLRKEFLVGGSSIKDEVTDFFEQLQKAGNFISSDQDSKKLSKFGQFANSIEWQQILAIALASTASRYGIDEILDDSFVKKIMAERISKFFNDPRTINTLMSGLPPAALQRAALFFASIDLANSVGGGFSIEERRLRRLNTLLDERAGLVEEERQIIQEGTAEEIAEIRNRRDELEARIEIAKERLNGPAGLAGLSADIEAEQEEENKDDIYIDELQSVLETLEGIGDLSTVEMPESEGSFLARQFLGTDLDETANLEDIEAEEEPGAGNSREPQAGLELNSTKKEKRTRLVNIARGTDFTPEMKNELIDLIIGLSNCDRQNNAEVYTEFIMFLVDELGAPILEYFDEWSEWLNAWDVKNLDFCNLPDLNLPDFKLFPLNIRLPEISMPDIFGFILGSVLSILYALLLRLINALVQFLLSLIPDFIFDFEPCEFANALRDFGQTLAGAICAGLDGVDLPSVAACSVLTPRIGNQRNNRDLLNFFKDACGKGILPGPDLARLLDGDASEGTFQRADVYFRAINSDLASEIRLNPSILSDAGSAMGSIIGIGDLLDTLDGFSPQLPGLSANGFVNNLDLCSDPSISDLIDQLCTEPNPALREELEKILQQQREADKDDAAKIFKYLTDPESLTREIEDQLPNQAHPSLLIPQLAAAGQTNELPVIKNTPKFALNRDQEALGELHEDGIKARLGSLDACITAYGKSLMKRSKNYEDKIDKLSSPLRSGVDPENGPIDVPLPQGAGGGFLTAAFNNDLFYLDEMPEAAREMAAGYADLPKIVDWSESFDIGLKFYEEQVYTPLTEALSIPVLNNPLNGLLTDEDLYSTSFGALNTQRIKEGQFVRQALEKVRFHDEVDFNALSRQIEAMGKDITIASLRNRLENAGIDLEPAVVDELMTESEELPPAAAEGDERELPVADNSNLLPSSQLEGIMENYLNGSFKQEKTYKRFIKELPEYSQLLLTKTDDEVVSIQENIKAIFTCILLEDAHLRFAVLDAGGRIFSTNNLSTATYNRSLLAKTLEIKKKINMLFFDFEVNYLNNKIRGWNAISYYVYEIAKTTNQLTSLNNTLGRRATPQDLMYLLLEEAISSVSKSFITNRSVLRDDNLQYSNVIEGSTDNSIIYNFKTPNLLVGHLSETVYDLAMGEPDTIGGLVPLVEEPRQTFQSLTKMLKYSLAPDGSEQTFLTSNVSFVVTLKSPHTLGDALNGVDLASITSEEQRSGTNSSSTSVTADGAGKGLLQGAVLNSLIDGEPVLLSYDDVFGDNEGSKPLMHKLYDYAERQPNLPAGYELADDLNDFIFKNFNIKIKYRVFVSYATKRLPIFNPTRRLRSDPFLEIRREYSELGTDGEADTLGLYKDQKISVMFARHNEESYGATFIMTELCSFEYPVPDYSMIEDNQDLLTEGNFISKLMIADNVTELANNFKGDASINIFLSCMLPVPNIINQATSYSVEGVQDQLGSSSGEVRDIIFKPVKIQNMICAMVSKRLLKNV